MTSYFCHISVSVIVYYCEKDIYMYKYYKMPPVDWKVVPKGLAHLAKSSQLDSRQFHDSIFVLKYGKNCRFSLSQAGLSIQFTNVCLIDNLNSYI